ncbi:MAG: preprotein translocase subunit SecE [Desulfobacterales bacterium]|nr:preprotein translocase subunit SecE [Desulfobacterales bacterium]
MGRIQRKKPDSKKKKKKQNVDSQNSSISGNNGVGNKVVSITDFSKIRKKLPVSPKKPVSAVKPGEEGRIDKALQFLREVKIELKKVTWPSRTQTIGSTVVVIVLVIIVSLFLGLVDSVLSFLVRLVLQ